MSDHQSLASLAEALGVQIDLGMLEHAVTHRSYSYEHGGLPHNERLEFLGDSVLGLVVTETLFRRHPDLPESALAKFRSSVVNARSLAQAARDVGLGPHLRLGRGEKVTGGRDKSSILSDCLEAIIGVVFLAEGMTAAEGLVHRLFDERIAAAEALGAGLDWKTSLQELGARSGAGVPAYSVEGFGPDHDRHFLATVSVGPDVVGRGAGQSKKQAEQEAAAAAYTLLAERSSAAETQGARQP